jgi:arginyl-tRNA synthetase
MDFSHLLKQHCTNAFKHAFPEWSTELDPNLIEITKATQEKFGHYQCNSPMKLAKLLGASPRNIAERWASKLRDITQSTPLLSAIDIAGPGFINLTLDTQFLSSVITAQLQDPRLGVPAPTKKEKLIIDFSSPNTAKEMHVGHLRSTIIGDCLARLFQFMGRSVLPLNHVGDWGTQFGMLIAHLKTILPDITSHSLPEMHLSDLINWYRASKKRFDEEPEFKKQAQQEVVALQNGNSGSKRAWEHICAISREAYQNIYDTLDVTLIERGESFYNPYLSSLVEALEQKNLVTLSEGAKCIYLEGFTNREGEPLPLILQKTDGAYNYATTDLAALNHRITVEKADCILYVVDLGQSLHFQMVFETAKKAGFYNPSKTIVQHVPFGLVLRPDGKKFKTRSGDTERLIDLIQAAILHSKTALRERNPDMSDIELDNAAHALGINAIKYADLSCHRTSDYVFSYEKMLRFEGNTAAFLLYDYVRIRSIQRKTKVDLSSLMAHKSPIQLSHPEEISLALLTCQFSEVLEETTLDLCPNKITDYLYKLAEKFHLFFHHCRVEGSDEQNSRLLLCEAVAQVLHQGFNLLGLKPLQRM